MVENFTAEQAYKRIKVDFKRAQNGIVGNESGQTRQGLMILAFMAMNLLEFVCRLCKSNKQDLIDFSNSLNEIEGRYFIHLPIKGLNIEKGRRGTWFMPHLQDGLRNDDLLLTLLFRIIRDGLGHQYQPSIVYLKDGKKFSIVFGVPHEKIEIRKRSNHLLCLLHKNSDIEMTIFPEYLLDHIDQAVQKSNLLNKDLSIDNLIIKHDEDIQDLKESLRNGGIEFIKALQ
jgi:hypothetical protein